MQPPTPHTHTCGQIFDITLCNIMDNSQLSEQEQFFCFFLRPWCTLSHASTRTMKPSTSVTLLSRPGWPEPVPGPVPRMPGCQIIQAELLLFWEAETWNFGLSSSTALSTSDRSRRYKGHPPIKRPKKCRRDQNGKIFALKRSHL